MENDNYPVTVADFMKKADKIIGLAEQMSQTFGKKMELGKFQRQYLQIAIAAGCSDSHHAGFTNGQYLTGTLKSGDANSIELK